MSSPTPTSTFDTAHCRTLMLRALVAQDMSQAERAELETLLSTHPTLRVFFMRACLQYPRKLGTAPHDQAQREAIAQSVLDSLGPVPVVQGVSAPAKAAPQGSAAEESPVRAGLVVVCTLGVVQGLFVYFTQWVQTL